MAKFLDVIKVVLVIGALVFIGVLIKNNLDANEELKRDKEIQAAFHKREMDLQTRLQDSRAKISALELRGDSLTARIDSIARLDSIHVAKLKSVTGKFNSLTSKQLQDKMIEEYNKRDR